MSAPLNCGGFLLLENGNSASTQPVPHSYAAASGTIDYVKQREEQNSIPGRYDNLPLLQSVYKDPAYALDANTVNQMQYEKQASAPTMLERQYTTLEPHVTPLSLGVLPQMSRGTGTMLPDPLTGDELKPQKRENRDVDMFMPIGQPLKGRDDITHIDQQMRIEQSESKLQSGNGALDTYTFQVDNPDCAGNVTRNFGNGEEFNYRTGGFHPRVRIFRAPETKRGRNEHAFRLGNPTYATGKLGSIYQTESAPLGELQLARNADVDEAWRAPAKDGGAREGGFGARSIVPMNHVNRDTGACDGSTEGGWTGPFYRTAMSQETRRLLNRYVRPKEQNDAVIESNPYRAVRGNNAAYSYYENQRHRDTMRVTDGRATGGVRGLEGVADGMSGERFYNVDPRATQKDTGLEAECIHAPASDRSMAMQRPESFYEPISRRVTPFMQTAPDYCGTEPYRSNPYTQPLPAVPRTNF